MKLLSDFYTFPKRFWQSIIIGRFDSYTPWCYFVAYLTK